MNDNNQFDKNKSGQDKDELLDSNYDGIQEYDNDLPKWWVYLFYLTIVFSFGYVVYYHGGFTQDTYEYLDSELAAIQLKTREAAVASSQQQGNVEQVVLSLKGDAQTLENGKNVYTAKCAVCHGQSGEGLIGPNLTDDYWIHGSKVMDLLKVIESGVLDKGMLAWKGQMPDQDIRAVTVYIMSLRGSNPPNAKAPQGEKSA